MVAWNAIRQAVCCAAELSLLIEKRACRLPAPPARSGKTSPDPTPTHRRIIPRRVRFSGDGLSLKKSPRRGSRHQLVGLRARDRAASSRTVTQATARFGWCGRSTATTTRQQLLSFSGCWSLIERRGGARSTATLSRRLYLAATDAVVIGACLAGPQVAGRGREPMLSSAASAAVACVQHPDA